MLKEVMSLKLRFQETGLALDIPISWINLPAGNLSFPVLKMTDTIAYMTKWDSLNKLLGDMPMCDAEGTLLEFWKRYSQHKPGHEVFAASQRGEVRLSRAIPCLVHGDEGRGFKRTGVMILSVQGAIGRGAKPFLKRHPLKTIQQKKMGVNIGGSSYNSRLLFGAMQKKHYSIHPETWKVSFNSMCSFLLCFFL